jgi:hypothetical protein
MAGLDYYSVMQKRIDFLAQKYDPLNKYAEKKEIPEIPPNPIVVPKPQKIKQKIASGYSLITSMLF